MNCALPLCALLAAVPRVEEMRGQFPITSTPELSDLAFNREATLRWFGGVW